MNPQRGQRPDFGAAVPIVIAVAVGLSVAWTVLHGFYEWWTDPETPAQLGQGIMNLAEIAAAGVVIWFVWRIVND